MPFSTLLKSLQPKQLFLIDGFGAMLSAFLLGVILTRFESTFGMPREALYFLAALPCLFALYDFACYFRITENWRPFLKTIAIANLLYCCLSIGFLLLHYPSLTALGWLYFLLELAIVIVLASMELKKARNVKL
jgi:hypothetical protein